jgi:hypothetical protein
MVYRSPKWRSIEIAPKLLVVRISRRRMGPSDPNFVVVVASFREELTHDDGGEEKIQKAVRCEDRRR